MVLYTTYNKYCVWYHLYVLKGNSVCCLQSLVSFDGSFSFFPGFPLLEVFPETPSCLLLVPVMPAIPRFLLLLQLFEVFGLDDPRQWVSILPIVLAVLVYEAHLRLTEDGQKVFVLSGAGGPGAGLEWRRHRMAWFHQDVVDGLVGQDHQLEFDQGVLEVLLCGCADVDARVGGLEGTK